MTRAGCGGLFETQQVAISQFSSELRPQSGEAGKIAQVVVENCSKEPRTVTVRFDSPNGDLTFEPAEPQRLHLLPGEVAAAEFRALPRNPAIFGGEVVYFFTSRVQTPREAQTLSGEVVGKDLIPTWLALVGLVLLLACTCLSLLAAMYAGLQ